jgi:cytoskeletal protein CcmA (bactofilin family)
MAGSVTVIGRSARVRGRVTGSEDLEVRGFVDGEIDVTGDVTVESEGLVGAPIHARRLVVRGAVKGDLVGEESVLLEDGARIVGDVRAPRVAIAPGALVRGYVETGLQPADASPRTARATQAAPRTAAAPTTIARAPAPTARAPGVKAAAAGPPPAPAAPSELAAPSPSPPNHLAQEAGPRRPPPPVVPALKKAKGQIARKKER